MYGILLFVLISLWLLKFLYEGNVLGKLSGDVLVGELFGGFSTEETFHVGIFLGRNFLFKGNFLSIEKELSFL